MRLLISLDVKNVKIWKRILSVLLVMTMLGSVVSPALAASTEQKVPACPSCSKVTTGKSKVTVVEINGIEKNEILAKALKNEDKLRRTVEKFPMQISRMRELT